MSKHTPGPWKLGSVQKTVAWQIESNGGEHVCELDANEPDYFGPQHNDANAVLIAAAPEMLDALELAKKELARVYIGANRQVRQETFNTIQQAINKASGDNNA